MAWDCPTIAEKETQALALSLLLLCCVTLMGALPSEPPSALGHQFPKVEAGVAWAGVLRSSLGTPRP